MKNAGIFQKLYYIIHFSLFIQLAILLIIITLVALLLILTCKTKADDLLPNKDTISNDNLEKQKKKNLNESINS